MATYLITGAGGGMGSVLCRKLAREGHRVLGIDLVLPDSMGGVRFFSADITRTEDLQAVADNLHAEGIHLDGLIHMAGIYDLNSLVEMPKEDFCRDFNVNLFALAAGGKEFWRCNILGLGYCKRVVDALAGWQSGMNITWNFNLVVHCVNEDFILFVAALIA